MARAVRNGKPASETSSRVTEARMSRARGPHSAKQTRPDVRSLSSTLPSPGRWRRSQAMSCCPNAVPVMNR